MAQGNNLMIDYRKTFYSPLNIASEYETQKEYNNKKNEDKEARY